MNILISHPGSSTIIRNAEQVVTIHELSSIETATCDSIHLADCMDFVPHNERMKMLYMACKKLKYGGELTVSGTDMKSLAHQIHFNVASTKQANVSLYGGRLSIDHINSVCEQIKKLNMKLINCKLDGIYFSIKAQRLMADEE